MLLQVTGRGVKVSEKMCWFAVVLFLIIFLFKKDYLTGGSQNNGVNDDLASFRSFGGQTKRSSSLWLKVSCFKSLFDLSSHFFLAATSDWTCCWFTGRVWALPGATAFQQQECEALASATGFG